MLFERGELLAPEEAYPAAVRVEGEALLVGHQNGTLSVFERPDLRRRYVVRAACGSSVTASGRSPSRRFFAIGTSQGVTVLDLVEDCWAFRPLEAVTQVTVDDDGHVTAITEGLARRFDGMQPDEAVEHAEPPANGGDRGGLVVDDDDRAVRCGEVLLAPPPPDGSIVSSRGVLVTRRSRAPTWFDFAALSSRAFDVGGEIIGGLALGERSLAVGSWSQTVRVMSLAAGATWQHKVFRKADLLGDYLPAFVLTDAGEIVAAQRVRDLLCLEAVVWFGPKGRRARLKLPQLGSTLTTLLAADATSVLLHVEGREGLWVFAEGQEQQLVPSMHVRWVDALHGRRAFVLSTGVRGGARSRHLVVGERVLPLERGDATLERAAFSPSGRWLALRWEGERPREARVEVWDVAKTERVAAYVVSRLKGALGFAMPGSVDLAIGDDGQVVTAITPSVYGFFAPTGERRREIAVLPEGEWIERTADAWSHSRDAFRWGGVRHRGRVLDEHETTALLGAPRLGRPSAAARGER